MTSTSIYTSAISEPNSIPQSKICNKCDIDKPIKDFSKSGTTYQLKCKSCAKEYIKEYRKANAEEIKKCSKEYRKENKEAKKNHAQKYYQSNKKDIKEQHKKYYQTTKEHKKKYQLNYQKENKGQCNARNATRRASKLNATPKWSEFKLIKQIYKDCELISEMTNVIHHVDHIIPLQSDIVCGLHCIENLQIISATENHSKSNSYWPDMP